MLINNCRGNRGKEINMSGKMGLVAPPGLSEQRGFRVFNVQPSQAKEGVGVCPHYQILLEGAMLIGNEESVVETYDHFCGQNVTSTFAHGGMISESETVTAFTFCDFVIKGLCRSIDYVENAINCEGVDSDDLQGILRDKVCQGRNELLFWSSIIPLPKGHKRTPKEMLDYVVELKKRIEQEVYGKIESFEESAGETSEQESSGCKQRPASPGFSGIAY